MSIETTVVEELHTLARRVQPPAPPAVAMLVRRAEQARARRRLRGAGAVALVAAAVLVAVVIGRQVGKPDAAPQPAHPSPSYYADGVPYLDHGGLYVDHVRQPGSWYTVESYGDFTIALATDQTAEILRDGQPIMHIDEVVQAVRLSFDGTKAAWITSDTNAATGAVVVRDLARSRDLGRLSIRLRLEGDTGVGVSLAVTNDGTAYYDVSGRKSRWKPGDGQPTATTYEPNGFPQHPPGFDGVEVPVRLSPDHLWGAWITDPEGHQLADTDGKPLGVTVQKPGDSSSRFTMPVPTDLDLAPVTFWTTPTQITFPGPENVQCDIVDRRCRVLGTS
jgi:hypothetical protein